jgi:hypothetical protein
MKSVLETLKQVEAAINHHMVEAEWTLEEADGVRQLCRDSIEVAKQLRWLDRPDGLMIDVQRLLDEHPGLNDCYVVETMRETMNGEAVTVRIMSLRESIDVSDVEDVANDLEAKWKLPVRVSYTVNPDYVDGPRYAGSEEG